MKKLIAILLVLSALLCLCACGGNKAIVGKWTSDIDLSKAYKSELGEMAEKISSKVFLSLNFDLNKDGTFTLSFDKEKTVASVNEFVDEMIPVLIDVACEQTGITREELEKELNGQDLEALMRESMGNPAEEILGELDALGEKSGKYKVDGNKLYMSTDDEEFDEDDYVEIELNGNTFSIVGFSDESAFGDDIPFELPLVFKK